MAAPFLLTDLNRIKTALQVSGQTQDGYLNALNDAVSGDIAAHLNRADAILRTARTEDLDVEPAQRWFRLRAAPVISIASASYDPLGDFGSGTVLAAENYRLKARTGQLYVRYDLITSDERLEPQSLRVVYTGGVATNLEGLRASEFAPIEQAALLWMHAIWKRAKTTPEPTSISGQGGSVTFPGLKMPDSVVELLRPFRRLQVR
jgi:hypothetical protein